MSNGIVDLEEAVQIWAWDSYKKTRSKKIPMDFEHAFIDINWSGVKFIPQKPIFTQRGHSVPKSQVIFKSVFRNESSTSQTHSLKTERETTATSTTSITKGYTKGFSVGLTLSPPGDVAEASVGFEKGFSIENVEETSDSKTLTWATEGSLTVQPNSALTAELQVKETQNSYSFETSVAIKGRVNVSIYNRLENSALVMSVMGDIKEILLANKDLKGLRWEGKAVYIDVKGKCEFKYGIEQQIRCYPAEK